MNVSSLEFNFSDFESVTLLQYNGQNVHVVFDSRKQFVREIRKINPTQNLRLLQYVIYGTIEEDLKCLSFRSLIAQISKL